MPVNVNEIESDEKIVEIEMERLREFRNHPFKVKADAQMLQLIESISKYGVMNPLIVRPLPEGPDQRSDFPEVGPGAGNQRDGGGGHGWG